MIPRVWAKSKAYGWTVTFLVGGLTGCGHGAVVAAEPRVPICRELLGSPAHGPTPELRWFGPGQDDEVVRHFEWCRAVGPSVSITQPVKARSIDSLAIVSYNMNLGGGDLQALLDSLQAGALTGGQPVVDFVVLVQEAIRDGSLVPSRMPGGAGSGKGVYPRNPSGSRPSIVATAGSAALHLFYTPAMRSGKGLNDRGVPEDRGNGVLSSLPIGRLAVVELPFGGSRRIAQVVQVSGTTRRGRSWQLDLANVHFDVGPIGPSALSAIRARQARAIAQVLEPSEAAVVAGDLNAFSLSGTAQSVQILERAFPSVGQSGGPPTRGWQRLDYMFFRVPAWMNARSARVLPHSFGSDHRPLLAWVRFD